jgi:hypothetical protein
MASRTGPLENRAVANPWPSANTAEKHWRGLIPSHEYFQGDNGAGIGASQQTGEMTGDCRGH